MAKGPAVNKRRGGSRPKLWTAGGWNMPLRSARVARSPELWPRGEEYRDVAALKRLEVKVYADGIHLCEAPKGPWTHYKSAQREIERLEAKLERIRLIVQNANNSSDAMDELDAEFTDGR